MMNKVLRFIFRQFEILGQLTPLEKCAAMMAMVNGWYWEIYIIVWLVS
jgi:hypothetical protein